MMNKYIISKELFLKISLLLYVLFLSVMAQSVPLSTEANQCNSVLTTMLSIDGGGVKGIVPVFYLEKLEELTQQPTSRSFDLMSGVSTGSIVVSLLAQPNALNKPQYSASDVKNFYLREANKIFFSSFWHTVVSLNGLIGPKYQSDLIMHVGNKLYGDTQLHEELSHVLFFGYDVLTHSMIGFCNWGQCDSADQHYKVRDIISGTTAIPSFFSPQILISQDGQKKHIIMDSSLILNNPTPVTFLRAQSLCPETKHYVVLSLGTGYNQISLNSPYNWGLIRWLPSIIQTTLAGETGTANLIMAQIAKRMNVNNGPNELPTVLFVRINHQLPPHVSNPLNASPEQLLMLLKIIQDHFSEKQELFTCLATLLKSKSPDSLSNTCIRLLKDESSTMLDSTVDSHWFIS